MKQTKWCGRCGQVVGAVNTDRDRSGWCERCQTALRFYGRAVNGVPYPAQWQAASRKGGTLSAGAGV